MDLTTTDLARLGKPMSKLSLASLFALGAGVILMALTVMLVFFDQMFIAGTTGRPHRESLTVDVLFFSSSALPATSIIGVGLGIAGLLYNGRGKKLAWLGVAGNALVLFLVCAVLALALLFEGYGATP